MSLSIKPVEGEKFTINISDDIQHSCCGCGLTHNVDIKILSEGNLEFAFHTNNEVTAMKRQFRINELENNIQEILYDAIGDDEGVITDEIMRLIKREVKQ